MIGRCGNFGLHFVWLAAAARPAASRVRGVTTSEFLSLAKREGRLVSLSQHQHPVIDLAELVSTKAGTISVAYSLTPPHVRLEPVQSQVIHHHSPSSHEQAFLP